jgi:hypothetical protein
MRMIMAVTTTYPVPRATRLEKESVSIPPCKPRCSADRQALAPRNVIWNRVPPGTSGSSRPIWYSRAQSALAWIRARSSVDREKTDLEQREAEIEKKTHDPEECGLV